MTVNRLALMAGLVGSAAVILAFHGRLSSPQSTWLLVAVSVVATAAPLAVNRRGIGIGPVYAGFYWLFHFGILAPVAMGFTPNYFNAGDERWATSRNLALAAAPVTLFLVVFAAAYLATGTSRSRERTTPPPERGASRARVVDGPGAVGLIVTLLGLALWAQIFLSSGASIAGGYVGFLAATEGSLTPYAYLLISAGMALTGATRHTLITRLVLAAFIVWGVPAFILGLRGEVLIPLLAFMVSRSRSGRLRVRGRWLVVGAIAGLSIGALVRVVRVGGIADWAAANPVNGLVELGYSIRPMVMVQAVRSQAGEAFTGIATYLAPIERLIVGRVLGLETKPISMDQDVFGTFIASQFGPIGGSVSAEAYRAGGLISVIIVAAIIGFVAGTLDVIQSTPISDAFVAMLSGILLLWIRNDVTPVVLSLAIVAVLLALTRLIPFARPQQASNQHPRMQEEAR